MDNINNISIPYGAIKSAFLSNSIFCNPEFQFLMVRLKVVVLMEYSPRFSLFQFLMVRLKVASGEKSNSYPCKFQFLMVRLKGL